MSGLARSFNNIFTENATANAALTAGQSHEHGIDNLIDVWLDDDGFAALGSEFTPFRFDNHFKNMSSIENYPARWTASSLTDSLREDSCVNLVGDTSKHDGAAKGREVRSPFGVVLAPCAICGQQQKNESEARYDDCLPAWHR